MLIVSKQQLYDTFWRGGGMLINYASVDMKMLLNCLQVS